MRVAVLKYPGIRPECYAQLIDAAMTLARHPRMQEMARWPWTRFSTWLRSHPFEMDQGAETKECATACSPKQRMRVFPQTMNCWERVLHQLAWFAARGAERATVYDHGTLVGRYIEVLVPPTTYLGAADTLPVRPVANGAKEQAIGGILGGLQGGGRSWHGHGRRTVWRAGRLYRWGRPRRRQRSAGGPRPRARATPDGRPGPTGAPHTPGATGTGNPAASTNERIRGAAGDATDTGGLRAAPQGD